MIRITADIIRALSNKEKPELVAPLVAAMNEFFPLYEIATEQRVEHFLAQAAHEADGFRTLTEYASGDAYDTRTDLGNTPQKDGDGRRYKGRGIFQTTGRTNYAAAGRAMGIDALASPELLATPRYAVWSACIYWKSRKLNALADKDDLRAITKKINGGYNGLADRQKYLERARNLIVAFKGADDPRVGPGSSPDLVRSLQKALADRNYQTGIIDGKWGRLTRDAVLALKADNGLDTGDPSILLSQATKAGPRVIETRQDATVADLRAKGSTTIKGADTVQTGSVITAAAGGIGAVAKAASDSGALDQAEQITGTASRWLDVLAPFQGLLPWMADNWVFFAIGGAGLVWYLARRAKQKRLAEFKAGKMG